MPEVKFVVLTLALVCAAGPAFAAAFANGSFESPGISVGTGPVTLVGGSSLGAWTVTGSSIDYGRTGAVYQGQTFTAFDGLHAIDVTGLSLQQAGGVAQTFDVLPSRRYRVLFAVGRFSSTLPLVGGTSTVEVRVNGVDLGIFVNDLVLPSYSWQPHSVEFQTSAGQTSATLNLSDANAGGPTTHVGLDGVVVELLPAPPVPAFGLGARLLLVVASVMTASSGLAVTPGGREAR